MTDWEEANISPILQKSREESIERVKEFAKNNPIFWEKYIDSLHPISENDHNLEYYNQESCTECELETWSFCPHCGNPL